MAWDTTTKTLLRVLINDIDSESYADARLDTVIINAAYMAYAEIEFANTYTIDIIAETISPDPTTVPDDDFTYLSVLKAACIIDQGEYRTKLALAGLMAKLGPAVLETSKHADGYAKLLTVGAGACALYQVAKDDLIFGNGNVCRAILSPFVGNNFDPNNIDAYSSTDRNRI